MHNLQLEKLRLENFTKHYGHENMYAKDYTAVDAPKNSTGDDDRKGMTSEKNLLLLRRVINTGLQQVFHAIGISHIFMQVFL